MSTFRMLKAIELSHIQLLQSIVPKLPDPTTDLMKLYSSNSLSDYVASTLKLFDDIDRVYGPIDIFKQQLDAMTATQREIGAIFEHIARPLSFTALDHIRSISTGFASQLEALSAASRFIGEFQIDDDGDDETSTSIITDESDESASIVARIELVRWLPIELMKAIAANPELMRGMNPLDFEKLVANLLEVQGFENIQLTKRSGDGGRDIIATRHVAGIPVLFAFECKRYTDKISVDIMRGLLGSLVASDTKANKGVLVTTSTFTRDARRFIASEVLLDGKDFNDLVNWLQLYGQKTLG